MTYTVGPVTATRPQAIAIVDDTRLVAANNINGVTVGLVGEAGSGPVNTPLLITNPQDAAAVLVSGELLDALRRAYAPGVVPGAYRVYVVRLDGDTGDEAVAGSLILKNTSSGNAIDLEGVHLGALDNDTAIKIVANSDGGVDITVYYSGGSFTGVNVGAKGFALTYTGTGATCTVTINGTGLVTAAATSAPADIPADDLNLPFATYTTLQRMVDAINANGAYTATLEGLNPGAASSTLDGQTALSIKTIKHLRCDLAAQVAWFNKNAQNYVTAAKSSGALKPAVAVAKTHLAGGADPTITDPSWTNAFAALESVNLDIVVPVSGSATVHAIAQAHAETMSDPRNKHERRVICGGVAGETPTQAIARALALNSAYVQLVYPGLKDLDSTGALVEVAPYLIAAQKSGVSAGLKRGTAATFQFLKAAGIARNCSQSELDALEEGGVMGIEFVTGKGFRIVHDRTTYLKSEHIDRIEFSMGLVLDQIQARLRSTAEQRVGQPGTQESRNIIANDITAECNRMAQEGLLVGSPAFQNLSVTISGTQVTVYVEVAVAEPLNFIGIIIVPTSANGL
jgi:hypothetical protein